MYDIQGNTNSHTHEELQKDLTRLLKCRRIDSGERAGALKTLFRGYVFSVLQNSRDTDVFICELNHDFDGASNYSIFESKYIDDAEALVGCPNFDSRVSIYHNRLIFKINSLLKTEPMQVILGHNPNVLKMGTIDFDLGLSREITTGKVIDMDLGGSFK